MQLKPVLRYFIGKLADSNDTWNRYMRVIQLGLIDTDSGTHSLSVLLSAMETSLKRQTALRQLSECQQQSFMRRVY